MGRKKPRSGREVRSSRPKREPYARILIVCEGSKTEPNYLNEVVSFLRLSSANIKIYGEECGSSPATVVQFAVEQAKKDGDYDQVYCVFDRDIHPDFDAAVVRCRDLKQRKTDGGQCAFQAITSSPCFEYWLILHYADTDAPIVAHGAKSAGDAALAILREHWPAYGKGMRASFGATRDRLAIASERCLRINSRDHDNPNSRVVDLMKALFEVREVPASEWQEQVDRALGINRGEKDKA